MSESESESAKVCGSLSGQGPEWLQAPELVEPEPVRMQKAHRPMRSMKRLPLPWLILGRRHSAEQCRVFLATGSMTGLEWYKALFQRASFAPPLENDRGIWLQEAAPQRHNILNSHCFRKETSWISQ